MRIISKILAPSRIRIRSSLSRNYSTFINFELNIERLGLGLIKKYSYSSSGYQPKILNFVFKIKMKILLVKINNKMCKDSSR